MNKIRIHLTGYELEEKENLIKVIKKLNDNLITIEENLTIDTNVLICDVAKNSKYSVT